MSLQILPLAVTMMAGPAIMAAIVLVTNEQPVSRSAAFIAGLAIATVVGVVLSRAIASAVGDNASLGSASDRGSTGSIIQMVLVALLVIASARNYLGRAHAKPPRWLGSLERASVRTALLAGVVVILLGPSDVVAMLAVGTNLEQTHSPLTDATPFFVLTVFLAALPLLAYVVFHRRVVRAMPGVRRWMATNTWLVNIVVNLFFIALLLSG